MKTRIKNVAPEARFYGFLPPHGVLLQQSQEIFVDGDLRTILGSGRGRYSRKTEVAALDAALDGLDLEYESVPDTQSSSSTAP